MTDLRTLLHEAAPQPSRAVDVDALVAEASRRRPWRRIGLWFASIAVVLGVGGGAIVGLAPTDRPSEVDALPGPSATTTTIPGGDDTGSVAARGGASAPPELPAAATTVPGARVNNADEPSWYWHEPVAERCDLEPGGYGVSDDTGVGHGAGFDDPRTQTCTFTAAEPGGYSAAGTWSLTIDRDGTRIERSHVSGSPVCADIGFIKPGDVVTVSVRTPGGATTADTYIHAGPGSGCTG